MSLIDSTRRLQREATTTTPYYDHAGITIYHGDCRQCLPLVTGDVIVTDPPYGIGERYASFVDSPEAVRALLWDAWPLMQRCAPLIALTPGAKNVWAYPRPTWILHWFAPAAISQGPYGFCGWNPLLVYGADPYKGKKADFIIAQATAEKDGHPCQKPEPIWRWMIGRVSTPTQTLVDPFMGSGTTLVIAKQLGQRAIGIELEEKYCEIAAQRLSQESLFAGDISHA